MKKNHGNHYNLLKLLLKLLYLPSRNSKEMFVVCMQLCQPGFLLGC